MDSKREQDNQELRQWIKDSGCLVHPAIQIPAYFDGIQGIGTKQDLPHKTVIIAIPSKLVITVPRCYNDPELKSLYRSSDELFDYQSDQDAQFNILCVFLMYHKMNIQKSPWKVYLKTIAEPETAVSWPDNDLAGLNKSVIQQILHVRKQCKKVQTTLCTFLTKTKQFKHLSYDEIVNLFRICYPTVLTRCFGYYFSTACMIPIADLMNHGCQTIDHQLIHLNFQNQKQFDQTYNPKKHKLNCQLMGLPKASKQSMPFRLDFLLKNQLIENDLKKLGSLKRQEIDEKIYQLLKQRLNSDNQCGVQHLDFCQQADEEDNDTDQDQQYAQTKSLEHIKAAEKQQMVQFQKYILQVEKLGDVDKRIKEQEAKQSEQQKVKQQPTNNQNTQNNKQEHAAKQFSTNQTEPIDENIGNKNKQAVQQNSQKKEHKIQKDNNKTKEEKGNKIFPNQNYCPIEYTQDSSQQSSCSQQQQWCLDETCYFTMSTHYPVAAGSQLYNSYGSRTNKFLLVWYGFSYPNNLYDSVTLRLQASFPPTKPKAKDIVLDTYVGGQGLCFKKNEEEQVRPQQVSREFRLKRTRLPLQFIMFLRLFLVNYYNGIDNYKVLCTVPSSLQFQLQMLAYLKQIIQCIYARYPESVLSALKQMLKQQTDERRKCRINFKITYLQDQIKILNENVVGVNAAIKVINKLINRKQFVKQIYADLNIDQIRKIREYLLELKTNFNYIMYSQNSKPSQATQDTK